MAVEALLAPELECGLKDIMARGGCVFPICSKGGKKPLPVGGTKIGKPQKGGCKLATNDPRIVWHYFRGDPLPGDVPSSGLKLLRLWRRDDQPNAGVYLKMSGLVAIDADNLDELRDFTSAHGVFPATYCVRSPRRTGGLHYYFKFDQPVRCRRTLEGYPHLDIKHDGYVLVAGSARRDMNCEVVGRYSVVDGSPIADIPKWLLDLVVKPSVQAGRCHPKTARDINEWSDALNDLTVSRARIYLAKMPSAVSGEGGHNATLAAARVLVRGFALSDDEAFDILAADYNPRCEPPWAEWELWHKIKSARECSTIPLGYLLDAHSRGTSGADDDDDGADSGFDITPIWEEDE
jgi:hypothetical protein